MAYLLRSLLTIMFLGLGLVTCSALAFVELSMSHISLAIPVFIYTIFAQAFVMFYFIGVSRLVENVHSILHSGENLGELFEEKPDDLTPYQKKVNQFYYEAKLCKRQTIPWTALILVLGMIAFFLGAAHDTNLVSMSTHSGVVYGFLLACLIGIYRQWVYLGKTHRLLRKIKQLFSIPDGSM
ncbi:hypothetical protein N9O57_00625 [bacterium]|nr:hypothetical protein [bacterium]